MSDSDFFREVDEAVRQDSLKKIWDRYGIAMLLGAFLIIASVAGYKGWTFWQQKQAAEAGARFTGALSLIGEGKDKDAIAAFRELAGDGPKGYRILSRFQLAAAQAKNGKTAEAVKMYDELASLRGAGTVLQGFAKVRAAALLVDEASLAEMKSRLDSVADGTDPWRHSARELLGLSAYRVGNMEEAERYFTRALVDPGVPQNMRQRVEMMLSLVVRADASPAAGAK